MKNLSSLLLALISGIFLLQAQESQLWDYRNPEWKNGERLKTTNK